MPCQAPSANRPPVIGIARGSTVIRLFSGQACRSDKGSKHCAAGHQIKGQPEEASARPAASGRFVDLTGVYTFELESFRYEIECRPDSHGNVAREAEQQPDTDRTFRPRHHQRDDQRYFEGDMRWDPETSARHATALRLDQLRTTWPCRIDNAVLVESATQAH